MSYELDAIMRSLDELNDTCGCPTFILPHELDDVAIPVPRTRRGRELFRSLLLEAGRFEREKVLANAEEVGKKLTAEIDRGGR